MVHSTSGMCSLAEHCLFRGVHAADGAAVVVVFVPGTHALEKGDLPGLDMVRWTRHVAARSAPTRSTSAQTPCSSAHSDTGHTPTPETIPDRTTNNPAPISPTLPRSPPPERPADDLSHPPCTPQRTNDTPNRSRTPDTATPPASPPPPSTPSSTSRKSRNPLGNRNRPRRCPLR